jgi:hypothetical protein
MSLLEEKDEEQKEALNDHLERLHLKVLKHDIKIVMEDFNVQVGKEHSFAGHAVTRSVEALLYKPEGCGLDSQWCHWNSSLT